MSDSSYNQNYTLFHTDVSDIASFFLSTYEPFKTRAAQIEIGYYDSSTDLGCIYNNVTHRYGCDMDRAKAVVQSIPHDALYVLINNPDNYGGAGYKGAFVGTGYNGEAWKKEMFVHELMGHAVGNLYDEYSYGTEDVTSNIEDSNCFTGPVQSPSTWAGLVGVFDYTPICSFTNCLRSSPDSVMTGLSKRYYNAVSQRAINTILDQFVGPMVDTFRPQVSMDTPLNCAVTNNDSLLNVNATDNRGVAYVQVLIDNIHKKTFYPSQYYPLFRSIPFTELHLTEG